MDRLTDHESFLRAIFDAPGDDTPRLVYADFLEEHGDPDRAELIRVQCERRRLLNLSPGDPALVGLMGLLARELAISKQLESAGRGTVNGWAYCDRGFGKYSDTARIGPPLPSDVDDFRRLVVATYPEWFGAAAVEFRRPWPDHGPARERGIQLTPEQVVMLLSSAALQRATMWNFAGHVEDLAAPADTEDAGTYGLIDMNHEPVITVEGVEALAGHRGARRITALTLTNNNLDNDAARALVRSPYLINLKKLDLLDGNRLRGRTWQQLLERFGPEVVG